MGKKKPLINTEEQTLQQELLEQADPLLLERVSNVRLCVKGDPEKWVEVAALGFFDEQFVAAQASQARQRRLVEALAALPEGTDPDAVEIPAGIERTLWLLRLGIRECAGFDVEWETLRVVSGEQRVLTVESLERIPGSLVTQAGLWIDRLTKLSRVEVVRLDFS